MTSVMFDDFESLVEIYSRMEFNITTRPMKKMWFQTHSGRGGFGAIIKATFV